MGVALLANGGRLEISGGSLSRLYTFKIKDNLNNERIAELHLDDYMARHAFYDIDDARFELSADLGSYLLGDCRIEGHLGGNPLVEMRANWHNGQGELITRHGHRYTWQTTNLWKEAITIRHDVSNQEIFTLDGLRYKGDWNVKIYPCEIPLSEFHGLLAVTTFYLITMSNIIIGSS